MLLLYAPGAKFQSFNIASGILSFLQIPGALLILIFDDSRP